MIFYLTIEWLFKIVSFLILIRVILSWVPHDPYHRLVRYLYQVTEPVLAPFRQVFPPQRMGGLDVSPIAALFILSIIKNAVVGLLF